MLSRIVTLYGCLGVLLLSLVACEEPADNTEATATVITTEEPTPVNTNATTITANPYLIKGNGFYGLLSGVPLAERSERLEKSVLKDGEGEFEIYYIKGIDGEKVGYVMPHTKDETLIGSITITTAKAKTEDGIGIGSTLGELQAQTPGIQVYGSEIESRTHAVRGRELFLLDLYETTYELEEEQLDPTTAIKQITIEQHQVG